MHATVPRYTTHYHGCAKVDLVPFCELGPICPEKWDLIREIGPRFVNKFDTELGPKIWTKMF